MFRPLTKDSAISLLLRGSFAKAGERLVVSVRGAGRSLMSAGSAAPGSPACLRFACLDTSLLTVLTLTVRPASERAWRIASVVWPSKWRRRISGSNASALRLNRPGGFLGVSLKCALQSR